MKAKGFTMCVALCLLIHGGEANSRERVPTSSAEAYLGFLSAARKVWIRSETGGAGELATAETIMRNIALGETDPGYPVCEYLRCRLHVQISRTAEAAIALGRCAAWPSVAPEAVVGLRELHGADRRRRIQFEDCLARLLPMSIWRKLSDAGMTRSFTDINPSRPIIPQLRGKVLEKIAEEAERGGFCRLAWMAYVESVYGGCVPSRIAGPPRGEAWFSRDTARLWQRAAENAWKAGERSLAYDYLAKFAIFGSEAQYDEAKQTAGNWKAGEGPGPEPEIPRAQRQKALMEVIRLYAELNAHPRALELIQTHRGLLDGPDELYAEYSKQWKAAVKSYVCETERAMLFGVNVTDAMDPATIRIPFACSPESVKEVKTKLAEILETKN